MTTKKHPDHWAFGTVREEELKGYRDIPLTGGLYKINETGVVVSRRRRNIPDGYWVVLKHQKSMNARPFNRVGIYYDGDSKCKLCQVSRLLLEAWVGPPPSNLHVAAHRNGVPDDDRLDNLLWALPQDVSHGQICRGTWAHGETSGSVRAQKEQVEAARKIVFEYGVTPNMLATALGTTRIRVTEWLCKTWDTKKWDGLENPLYKDKNNGC